MSNFIKCSEDGCKNEGTNTVKVALRSRPQIPMELSMKIGYVCNDHKQQTISSFVPQNIWDIVVGSFRDQRKVPPVKTVSYLVIKPIH